MDEERTKRGMRDIDSDGSDHRGSPGNDAEDA